MSTTQQDTFREYKLSYDIDTEEASLGCVFIDPKALDDLRRNLRPADYFREMHQLVYRGMCEIADRGDKPELMSVVDWLGDHGHLEAIGGISGVTVLANRVPESYSAPQYAQIILKHAVRRMRYRIAHLHAQLSICEDTVVTAKLVEAERQLAELMQRGKGESTGTADASWGAPTPLPDGTLAVDAFYPELLPEALREWIEDIADRMQVPADFPAVGALVAAAALAGRQVGIYPKKQDDWLVVPNLWGAIVGLPSAMKSPALAEAMKPLSRLAADAVKAYQDALAEYEIQVALVEARKKIRAEKIKKAAKAEDEDAMERLAREALDEPESPTLRRYKTNDATVEKSGELLLQNPNGLLQFRDELSGWLRTLEKQGHEADRAFYLESWIGTGAFDVDRIGRGSLHIPALCLSLLGGIQPGPLASYVYDATSEGSAGNDGLLQRFQLLVWPDMPKTWHNVDRWPDVEAKNRAYHVYERLVSVDVAAIGATAPEGEPNSVPAVRFSVDAQEMFDEWREKLEQRLRSDEMSAPLQAHLAKYRSLMPSLALLFHLMDAADDPRGVNVNAAVQAIAWCEYLESHARRLYAHAENPGMERARALLAHIQAGDVADSTPIRALYRNQWSRLRTLDEMADAIKTLEAYGWVRTERLENGRGRSSDVLRIHPDLIKAQEREAA